MKTHVFYTWLLANLLTPLGYLVLIYSNREFAMNDNDISVMPLLVFSSIVVSGVFSLPCLIISLLVIRMIVTAPVREITRFFRWALAAIGIVCIYGILLLLIFGGGGFSDVKLILIPSVLPVTIAIAIRFRQFIKMVIEYDQSNEAPERFDFENTN